MSNPGKPQIHYVLDEHMHLLARLRSFHGNQWVQALLDGYTSLISHLGYGDIEMRLRQMIVCNTHQALDTYLLGPRHEDKDAEDGDSDRSVGIDQEAGEPRQRDQEAGEPRQRDQETGEPRQRDQEAGEPRQRDQEAGEPRQRGQEAGEPRQRDQETGEPRQRDQEAGEPRQRDQEAGEPRQRDQEAGEPRQRDQEVGEPRQRDQEAGEPRHPDQGNKDTAIAPRLNHPPPPPALIPRQMPATQHPMAIPNVPYYAYGCVPMGGMPWMAGFGPPLVAVGVGYGGGYPGNGAPISQAPPLPLLPPAPPSRAPVGADVLWEWYEQNEDEPYAEGDILDDLVLRSGMARGDIQKWLCNRRHRDGKAKNKVGRRAKKDRRNDKKGGKQ